jgi:hypothetical protein
MIKTLSNISYAIYPSLSDIDEKEIGQSSLVKIAGNIPGGIYHPQSIVWKGNLSKNITPEKFIRSKRERKALKNNFEYLEEHGLELKTVVMTEEIYNQFISLYKQTTEKVERFSLSVPVEQQLLGKIKTNASVYCSGVFDQNKLISGLAFHVIGNNLLVIVGAKKRIQELRGGVGGILEYELLKFSLDNKISNISHGRSQSPAGLVSKLGLFEFKARYGFTAFPTEEWETSFILNKEAFIDQEGLFITIKDNELCYLVVSNEEVSVDKYITKEIKKVITANLDDLIKQHRIAIKNLLDQK